MVNLKTQYLSDLSENPGEPLWTRRGVVDGDVTSGITPVETEGTDESGVTYCNSSTTLDLSDSSLHSQARTHLQDRLVLPVHPTRHK